MSEDNKKVTRNASINGAATSLSRVLGLVRDMTMTNFFGTGKLASAFLFAFTIPNLLRKLFGEGALASAFVPLFAEALVKDGKDEAYEASNILISILLCLLSLIAFLIAIACILSGAFFVDNPRTQITLLLTAIMIPYCIFICLTAVCGSMLNTLGHFAKPALAPVLLNISIIAFCWIGAWTFGAGTEGQMFSVAYGVILGGITQLVLQIPELYKRGFKFSFVFDPTHHFVKKIVTIMAPAVLGIGVTQFNIMIDRILAMSINDDAVAVLFYADRLVELPLGIFGIAIATAFLPSISFFAAKNEIKKFSAALIYSLRQIAFVILPSMVGLVILANPIIDLIFQRGEFTAESTMFTSGALQFYAMGLIGFAFIKIIVPAFYARKDTKTPVKVGICVLVINLVLNLILMQFMAERGLALSTAICSYLNVGVLLFMLRLQIGPLGLKAFWHSFWKIALNTAVMGVIVWLSYNHLSQTFASTSLSDRFMCAVIPIALGAISYLGIALIFRQNELREFIDAFKVK